MKNVAYERVYSANEFIELLTGKDYLLSEENTIEEIHDLLIQHGIESEETPLWDFPLSEIDEIVANNHQVVLVNCSNTHGENKETIYRWFEIPEIESNMSNIEIDSTEDALKIIKDIYIEGRLCGYPMREDDWDDIVSENLNYLNYNKDKVKSFFDDLCNS